MKLTISRENSTPIYLQIYEQIKRQVLKGELAPGYRLPPERKLAESLGVNRTTILNAYRELKSDGLIGSHVGNGTVVLSYPENKGEHLPKSTQEPAFDLLFSQYSSRFGSNILSDLLALVNKKDVISFAIGVAAPEIGPLDALASIEKEILERSNYKALMHSPTEGFASLRSAVCGLMQKRGVYCGYEEVMLLSGSQQGVELAARIFLDPGDMVIVEEPTFFPALQAFKSVGARIMGIPLDEGGMNLDLLEQLLQRYRPKLIYTMPSYHNPTGIEMSLERRKRLLELAIKYRVVVLEDDAYGELSFENSFLPLLKSMDNEGYVIYLSTFTKSIYPGLRLGWITAHKKVVKRFAAAKQIMDLHSSSLSQQIVESFIRDGHMENHIQKLCKEFKSRRDAMCSTLARFAPAGTSWNKPAGGYYIWVELPEGISATKLAKRTSDYGVAILPGTPFYISGQGDDHIRLNFTYASEKEIEVGIKRLCSAMNELIEQQDTQDDGYEAVLEINPIV